MHRSSSEDPQIRQAKTEDLDAVMDLVRRIVPAMRQSGNLQWDDEYPHRTVFESDVDLKQLWIAEVPGQIAAIAAITTDQQPEYADAGLDTSETAIVVHRLAVDPAFRGRGIAAALLLHAEQIAKDRGIYVLRIDTGIENSATQKLFPKLGYALAGEVGLSFRPGLRVLCYEKRLTGYS